MEFYYSEKLSIDSYKGIHLLPDHIGTSYGAPWDDYGYEIKFQVYLVDAGKKRKIGNIRLLVHDETTTSKHLKKEGEQVESKVYIITNVLDRESAISLPMSINFYSKLHKLFKPNDVETILSTLCDASYYYSHINEYQDWPGFQGALLREGSKSEAILKKGIHIANGRYEPEKTFEVTLENIKDTFEDVNLHFNTERTLGVTNINLLIGENGVGKTHVLKYLSDVFTGLTNSEVKLPFFHKLIVVSYSPFDTFNTQKQLMKKFDEKYEIETKKKKREFRLKRKKLNVNEYAYIGFRNDDGEFELNLPIEHSVDSLLKIIEYDLENSWWDEDTRLSILKETLSKSIAFDTLALDTTDGERITIGNFSKTAFKNLKGRVDKSKGITFMSGETVTQLSSGQQIYSYMLPAITAEIEDESLIIIDEPELYLHPSLEVGLLDMLKYLLAETKSYAVVATHSAVIAREVERKSVSILKKQDGITTCSKPSFETYGESIELIMGEVFDDFFTDKPYQKAIDDLIDDENTPESLAEELGSSMGDEALAYVLSKSVDNDFDFDDEDE